LYFETGARHEHLAAHFQHLGPAFAAQAQRDRADRAQVGGHVLAGAAVAAGGAEHEHAVFVAQADGQAIQLGLGREQRLGPGLLDAAHEIAHFLVRGIAQRKHRHCVADLGEAGGRHRADAAGGRIGRDQLRMGGFERLQLAHQAVVLGVRDVRVVEHVVAVIGVVDATTQIGDLVGGRGIGRHGEILGQRAAMHARMSG
jgi:hypothetical protein